MAEHEIFTAWQKAIFKSNLQLNEPQEHEKDRNVEMSGCADCQRPYGHEHGFPDLIIPFWAWKQITPTENDGGLLCPSCICKRLYNAGIRCEGAFMSGPIISVSEHAMDLHRRIENIELACEGRNNRWLEVRDLIADSKAPLEPLDAELDC